MSNTELDLTNMDALLNAVMDDLEDLPPMGTPPSGHYNFTVSMEVTTIGDQNKQVIAAKYVIDAINELKNEDEASEVAVGMQFTEFFHTTKKDGSANTFGIGKLKQRLSPFASLASENTVGGIINAVNQIAAAGTIVRKASKRDPDQYNLDIKDIIVL